MDAMSQTSAGAAAPFDPYRAVPWADHGLCERALSHSSWAHEAGRPSNEVLELLGDSVLDLLAAEWLAAEHPDWGEGRISSVRAGMVCRAALNARARALGVPGMLRLGVGAEREGLRRSADVAGDALEALVGAAYLDGGLGSARAMARWAGIVPPAGR